MAATIKGTWEVVGSYVTLNFTEGTAPYRTYFSFTGSIINTQERLVQITTYADINGNGIFDPSDLLLGSGTTQTLNTGASGSSGTFETELGSNKVYSYIGGQLVGETTFDTSLWTPTQGGGDQTPLTIQGDDSSNLLVGTASDELIIGLAGNDTLRGGAAHDTLRGGVGDDIISGGGGNDELRGGAGNDSLNGGSDDDRVFGGTGNDAVAGGQGVDNLSGGSGIDSFIFNTPLVFGETTSDHITDFSPDAGERIEINANALGIPTNTSVTLATVNDFNELTAALASSDLFIYDLSNGNLYWNQDGILSGSGAGGVFAVLDNQAQIAATNINLF